jgi:hypothetical protein
VFLAGYASVEVMAQLRRSWDRRLNPHVPGRGLDRLSTRVVPGVLVVAGLGLIGLDLNCQGGSVRDCAQPASRGVV